MDGTAALPEWLITVCTALGVLVAATVTRLGWKTGDKNKNEESAGGLSAQISHLDSSSSVLLASALEAATKAAKDMATLGHADRELSASAQTQLALSIERLTNVVREMHEHHVREVEEREERERRELEREVDRLRRERDGR